MEYRKLTNEEIAALKEQMCIAEDWSTIEVTSGFSTEYVRYARFSGTVRIGAFNKVFELAGGIRKHSGLYDVTLHNVTVGDDCCIENVKNYIANYEIGRNAPVDSVVSLICREFRINETWLRTGEGPMMHEMDEDQEMEDIIASLVFTNTDRAEGIRAILRAYWKLPEEAKKAIDQLIDGMRR